MNKSIIVPTSLKDIPWYQYLEFEQLSEELSDNDRAIQTISIFCGLNTNEVKQMPIKVLESALIKIQEALRIEEKWEMKFELNGVKYGFVPKLDSISTAEFIDIDNYLKERRDMPKLMSVLYRPIVEEDKKGRYQVEPYNGTLVDDFNELSMHHVKHAQVFFCNLGIDLLSYIRKCLKGENLKTSDLAVQELVRSVKNGDGTEWFMDYVEETYSSLMMWYGHLYTKPYCGSLTC